MQDNVDFDSLLFRQVAHGKEFEKLIPKSTCTKVAAGIGDTSYSMQQMAEMVKEYSYQVDKVAQKLQTSSLINTLENVKDFIYSHFQYKADLEDQLLRSPACAWYDRHTGIDCKSYSILASCLLTELGITHYIRRIKQPGYAPREWTHVYVVVPFDQKNGNLNKGYYTIDGTLEYDNEPAFIQKDDLKMSLQHYKLNAPAYNRGMGSSPSQQPGEYNEILNKIKNFKVKIKLKDIFSINSVAHFFQGIFGCGKTAYPDSKREMIVANIHKYFLELVEDINIAVLDKNMAVLSKNINEFKGMSKLLPILATDKINRGGWNKCTDKNLKITRAVYEFYRNNVLIALDAWIADNFTTSPASKNLIYDNKIDFGYAPYLFDAITVAPKDTYRSVSEPEIIYTAKPKDILGFEITPYVVALPNPTSFNPLTFIEGLSTTIASFSPPPTTQPGVITPGGPNTIQNPTTQTAGFGTIGWIILGVGATLFIKGMKSNIKDNPTNV